MSDCVQWLPLAELTLDKRACLSSNGREHWRAAAAKTQALRTLAALTYRTDTATADVERPITLRAAISIDSRRRFDPPNYWPTLKALIDGLTDAGHWADDNKDIISGLLLTAGDTIAPKGKVHISLTYTRHPL